MTVGQFNEARRAFEKVTASEIDNSLALNNLAVIAAKEGNCTAALDFLNRARTNAGIVRVADFAFRLVRAPEDRPATRFYAFYPARGDTNRINYTSENSRNWPTNKINVWTGGPRFIADGEGLTLKILKSDFKTDGNGDVLLEDGVGLNIRAVDYLLKP